MHSDRNGSNKNLQFNINMDNNNGHNNIPIINENDRNYHRYKDNPIIKTIINLQKAVIDQQNKNNTVNHIHKISNEYTLAGLNKSTPYLPTIHKKLYVIRGSCNNNNIQYRWRDHNICAIDIHNKKKYNLLNNINDPIIKYISWDVEFSGMTVINNISTKLFQQLIFDNKERMLFSLEHGLNMIKYNKNNKTNSELRDKERQDYLDRKCAEINGEYKSSDIISNKTCSILLRCGGSIARSEQKQSGMIQRVNGLVLNTGDWVSSLPNIQHARYGCSAVYSKNNGVIVVGGKMIKAF